MQGVHSRFGSVALVVSLRRSRVAVLCFFFAGLATGH